MQKHKVELGDAYQMVLGLGLWFRVQGLGLCFRVYKNSDFGLWFRV